MRLTMRSKLSTFVTGNLAKLLTLAALLSSVAVSAGTKDSGSGLSVQSAHSKHLVLWDLFVNDPTFNDNQPGDQIHHLTTGNLGEWVDYRDFKSFAYLKTRLAKWQLRAKNLVALINDGGFAETDAANPYRLLLIQTPLFIQSIDEIKVPDSMMNLKIKTYPTAYYDGKKARVFLNENHWAGTGLISQAGTLLHERARDIQINFQLTNEELQKLVYMILVQDPATLAANQYDDSRFSKSWLVLHSKASLENMNRAVGEAMDVYFRGGLLDCTKNANPVACTQKLVANVGTLNYPAVPPTALLGADGDILDAKKRNILGEKDPGPLPLVSRGSQNAPIPEIPTSAPFAKMYGSYKVIHCKNALPTDLTLDPCGFEKLDIVPVQVNAVMTSFRFTTTKTAGLSFFTLLQAGAEAHAQYKENGDQWASLVIDPAIFKLTAEYTLKKISETKYVLHMKSVYEVDPNGNPDLTKMNSDCGFELEKI